MQQEILRKALETLIAKLDIGGVGAVYIQNWDGVEYEFLALCLKYKVATIKEVRDLLHLQLLAIGRENYGWVTQKNPLYTHYPDHCASPAALGYAIQYNEFTESELKKITFDHGESISTFMRHEAEGLLDRVVRRLVRLTS
jgi:hypothetical protein